MPSRQPGQDLRDVPTYTIPEAAAFLAVPARTLHNWFTGPNSLLKPSSIQGKRALLSFRDISEAYVLEILRTVYGFSLRTLRESLANARKETKIGRPLIEADLRVVLQNLVIEKPARGKLPRRYVDIAHHRNLVIPELVDIVGERVLKDNQNAPYRLYPWRLLTPEDHSCPVTIDPEVMSGRAVITGTRIPISILAGMTRAGKTPEQIAKSYHLDGEAVRKAIQHFERPVRRVA